MDDVFTERLWRSVKYEEIYLNGHTTVSEVKESIGNYVDFYNRKGPHESLGCETPAEVYFGYYNRSYHTSLCL